MNEELLRMVDSIHRDKGIDKALLFESLEQAILSATRKRYGEEREIEVAVDRLSGEISAVVDGTPLEVAELGRIAAQTAKQVMIQRIREAERDVVYTDYEHRMGSLVTGTVQRIESGCIIVNLGRAEGLVPRSEQVFNESYRPGERIRTYVFEVKKKGQKVLIILSRTNPNLVRELFALEIPEISDRIVEIKHIVREPGHRTKIAVVSIDPRVDPIGTCVGVRGTRIRNIVDELNGEKIDIIRWNESDEIFIRNALSPAEISFVELDREEGRARVIVPEDQLSLAIGKRGQNVRLSSRLTGWNIDILTEEEARRERDEDHAEVRNVPGIDTETADRMIMAGLASLRRVVMRGPAALLEIKGIEGEKQVQKIFDYAQKRLIEIEEERAKRAAEEAKARVEERARLAAEAAAAAAVVEGAAPPEAAAADPTESSQVAGGAGASESEPGV